MYQIYLKPYKNIVQLLTRFWIHKKGDFFFFYEKFTPVGLGKK